MLLLAPTLQFTRIEHERRKRAEALHGKELHVWADKALLDFVRQIGHKGIAKLYVELACRSRFW